MASLELLETFADGIDVLLDPWAADWTCGWPDGLIGPLGGKIGSLDSAMAWILDNLSPMRRSFFFFEKFSRQISAGVFVGSIGWRDGFWTRGWPRGTPPYFGVTSVGPKGCPSPWS